MQVSHFLEVSFTRVFEGTYTSADQHAWSGDLGSRTLAVMLGIDFVGACWGLRVILHGRIVPLSE